MLIPVCVPMYLYMMSSSSVCDKATGRPHRFRNLTVWRSKAVVPTNNVVDNTTEIEVDISGKFIA